MNRYTDVDLLKDENNHFQHSVHFSTFLLIWKNLLRRLSFILQFIVVDPSFITYYYIIYCIRTVIVNSFVSIDLHVFFCTSVKLCEIHRVQSFLIICLCRIFCILLMPMLQYIGINDSIIFHNHVMQCLNVSFSDRYCRIIISSKFIINISVHI